jgi:hypothetical protein
MLACNRANVTLFKRKAGQVEEPAAEPISVRGVVGDEPRRLERLQQPQYGGLVYANTLCKFVE